MLQGIGAQLPWPRAKRAAAWTGNPALPRQRSHLLAMPILASLAWRIYQASQDRTFLADVFQPLLDFLQRLV